MGKTKWLTMFVVLMFLITSISTLATSLISTSGNHYVASVFTTTAYPNSDVSSLWIRRNGSDPGFPYGGANVSPSVGMNYFGTNVLQVTPSYNFTNVADTTLFPTNSVLYLQTYGADYADAVADLALTDSRIRGVWIDDFRVGLESPANLSLIFNNTHHNDATLGYKLTLGLVVYQYNYFTQYPYSWAMIRPWFDIIHFWYYAFRYPLNYPGLAGYEDDFLTFHSWMPEKEYWLGIYLHWYNVVNYPLDFTYEQMSIGGKLIKLGYATRYSILENFWIQHNPETSALVRDFINDELQRDYTTLWQYGATNAITFRDGLVILNSAVKNITYYYRTSVQKAIQWIYYQTVERSGYIFDSSRLQILIVSGVVNDDFILWNLRNGNHQFPYSYDAVNDTASYILEPSQRYRMFYFPLTNYTINTDMTITGHTVWSSLYVTINANIIVKNELGISFCIVRFGNDNYNNSMVNFTYPRYGFTITDDSTSTLDIYDSIVEPVNRAYPYHLTREDTGHHGEFRLIRSIIACPSHLFAPRGYIDIIDSTMFQVQPDGSNNNALLWLEVPSRIDDLSVFNSLFWNYDVPSLIGVFMIPGTLNSIDKFFFNNNTIIGGNYGLWVDLHYSYPVEIFDFSSYTTASDSSLFTTFRLDGEWSRSLTVHTYTIFHWSIKSVPGASVVFKMNYPHPSLENGLYTLTIDNNSTTIGITSQTLLITYVNPWLPYRNNFSLVLFSSSVNTEATIDNLIWLLFIFIAPIAMAQAVPKIGFIFGIALMMIVVTFEDITFLPYMFMGMLTIGIVIFKWR